MNVTVFNPAQLQVLEMMSFVDSPEALAELKKAISDYFAKQAQKEIDRLQGKLNNAGFTAKAPADVIEKEQEKLKEYQEKHKAIEDRIEYFKNL